MIARSPAWSLYCGSGENGIYHLCLRDGGAGFESPTRVDQTHRSFFLATHPFRPVLYSIDLHAGTVTSFAACPDGALELIDCLPTGGKAPCHLAVDPRGRLLLVAHYEGEITLLPILSETGGLAPVARTVILEGKGACALRQDRSHPHGLTFNADGTLAYVADLGADRIFTLAVGGGPFSLELIPGGGKSATPGAGPRHIALTPSGNRAVVVNELSNTLAAYRLAEDREFMETAAASLLPSDFVGESFAAEVACHPNEPVCYASVRGHDSLVALTFDAREGTLHSPQWIESGGTSPQHFILSPEGDRLFAANTTSDSVSVFDLHPDTAYPVSRLESASVRQPMCLAVVHLIPSPHDRN
jgi:6-phosphogluconolactonase